MRKSILRFGALALMSMMSIGSFAFEVGNARYTLLPEEGKVRLDMALSGSEDTDWDNETGTGDDRNCWKVTYDSKNYVVTEVAANAFAATNSGLNIVIPSSVTKIGNYAFTGKTITSVDLAGVTEIGSYAFEGATFTGATTNLIIMCDPSEGAFHNAIFADNTSISLYLPEGTEKLNVRVFGLDNAPTSPSTDGLTTIQLQQNSVLQTVGDFAFQNRTALVKVGYPSGNNYYLPKTVTEIGNYAFAGCSADDMILRFWAYEEYDGIQKVGSYAFKDCKWLNNGVFENVFKSFAGLTYNAGSFKGCGLTSIDLSNSGVIEIPDYAFDGNELGTETDTQGLKLPEGCTSIGQYAFANNKDLQVPALPADLKYIKPYAFARATTSLAKLENTEPLYLPENLNEVGKYAFSYRTLNVYANPNPEKYPTRIEPTGSEDKTETINLYVPAKAPFIDFNKWGNNKKTNVEAYKAYGWETSTTDASNIKYAQNFVTTNTSGSNSWYSYTYEGVTYRTGSTDFTTSGIDNNGCFEVKVSAFSKATPEVIGYIEVQGSKLEGSNQKEYTLKNGEYTYPLVLKVTGFVDGLTLVYEGTEQNAKNITGITFSPKNANVASGIVAELKATAAYNTIPASPFSAQSITSISMSDGITTVAEGAFKDTKVTEITLPATLGTLKYTAQGGTATFPSTLETVKVSYNKDVIPTLQTGVFDNGTNHLEIADGNATRENYLAKNDGWSKFFDNVITVNVKKGDEENATRLATKDEQVTTTGGATTWTRYYELVDAGNASEITSVSISIATEGTKIPVKYVRDFSEAGVNKFQCWYVPFEYKHTASDLCTFYYIYDTKQIGEGADATTSIEVKEVKNDEGKDFATIKANLPYVVKPSVQNVTFEAEAIMNTPTTAGVLSFTNVVNSYAFKGTYEKKTGSNTAPFYSLYATDGALHPFMDNSNIWAYRFYLDIAKRIDANPYGLVKFVVLDDEDATSIEDVKANSLNAPMFDLMGRQITAPAKGQVYIQNGVKKLAK